MPSWLPPLAIASLSISAACALFIAFDVARRPQAMWIMNIVWPVTALWSGPLGLFAYLRWGRASSKQAMKRGSKPREQQPLSVLTIKAATHCGSGCTLGDIAAELLFIWVPISVFGHRLFGSWIYDFIAAYALGILFQYFTIKPMRDLSVGQGLVAAVKADTASLVSWQIGMYGWMAITTFAIFGHELPKGGWVFWFMMQIAMFCGFACAYPVNRLLLQHGVKEKM